MLTLHRITTRYVALEDRIALSGEDAAGEKIILWLTQRLTSLIVAHLCERLESSKGAGEREGDPTGTQELIHEFAQQAARGNMTAQPPVAATSDTASALVRDVDITVFEQGERQIRLVFKDADQTPLAELTLATAPLRQWLNVVYDAYRAADWPLAIWPDWIREAVPVVAEQPMRPLH